jgi:L,D-transpeptidase YbiS
MAKQSTQNSIHVSVPKQRLSLKKGRKILRTFPISSSSFGLGTEEGSMKTPLGRFRIAEKFGAGLPHETAFKSRKPIRLTPKMLEEADLIMSRILWLDGIDPENANSHERFIYIHGTNHEESIGQPASHGCIRMKNADVAELFDLVEVETRVVISNRRPAQSVRKKVRKALRSRNDPPK